MDGGQQGIVSSNTSDVSIIQSWLIGTDVEKTLFKVRELEKESERIKTELTLAKKNLAKALRN